MPKIRTTTITGNDLVLVKANARSCWLGGASHVRSSDRTEWGEVDQLVGQLGEFALARFLGDPDAYHRRRSEINKDPWKGDDGSDFPGLRIDVKTSFMRVRDRSPLQYTLVVRPAERHSENIYVLAVVTEMHEESCMVKLVGYARDEEFGPARTNGVFAGAHCIPGWKLHDLGGLQEMSSFCPDHLL